MKISTLSILLTLLISSPAMAEKPSWAGKGKPTAEQKQMHQSAMDEKEKMEGEYEDAEDDMKKAKKSKEGKGDDENDEEKGKEKSKDKSKNKDNKDNKGLEKQKDKKSEQERKESGKGSDKGKEARETHSKKWWKFWGE
jgi:hypothetical protein